MLVLLKIKKYKAENWVKALLWGPASYQTLEVYRHGNISETNNGIPAWIWVIHAIPLAQTEKEKVCGSKLDERICPVN